MRLVRHPFVERDLIGMVEHVVRITEGDYDAAFRRLDEVDALLHSVLESPTSGVRLRGKLDSWLVRHGGADQRLTVVFRPDLENDCVYLAMVAFGGRDWMRAAVGRRTLSGRPLACQPSSIGTMPRRHGAGGLEGLRHGHSQPSNDPRLPPSLEQGPHRRPEASAEAQARLGHPRAARVRREPPRPRSVQHGSRQQAARL